MRFNFKKISMIFVLFVIINKSNLFSMQDPTIQDESLITNTGLGIELLSTPEEITPENVIESPTQVEGTIIEQIQEPQVEQVESIIPSEQLTTTIPETITPEPFPAAGQPSDLITPELSLVPQEVPVAPTIPTTQFGTTSSFTQPSYTPSAQPAQAAPTQFGATTTQTREVISITPEITSAAPATATFTVTIATPEGKSDPTDQIKAELKTILEDSSKSGTIDLLNTNVISESTKKFEKTYLQDYPSASNSIYAAIKNFYNNRTNDTLGNLQILLKNSQKKAFLTLPQQSEVNQYLTQVQDEIKKALESFLSDSGKTGTPALLNTNVIIAKDLSATEATSDAIAIFNQDYLQNYPSSSNSIYTAIKNFYSNKTQATLGDLQTLLTNAQNKEFLTGSQNSDVQTWLSDTKTEIKSLLSTLLKDKSKTGTPALLNVNVVSESAGTFNQAYLQNYPSSSNSIYTAIKNFYLNQKTVSLYDLETLLTNAQNKIFLTALQNSHILTWLTEVSTAKSTTQTTEITRVTKIIGSLKGKSYDNQFSILQNLIKSINPFYDYTSVQSAFWNAIQNLHNARPKTNSLKLQILQAWYGTLSSLKLTSSETDVTTLINEITTDLGNIASGTTDTTAVNVDEQITKAIKKALSKTNIKNKISELIEVTKNFESQKVSNANIKLFSAGLMTVGGNKLNNINTTYQNIKNEVSASKPLTTPQKNKIKTLIN